MRLIMTRLTETRRPERLAVVLVISTILVGCSGIGSPPPSQLVAFGLAANPQPAAFDVCRIFGCTDTARVSLSKAEWAQVQAMFTPPPANFPLCSSPRLVMDTQYKFRVSPSPDPLPDQNTEGSYSHDERTPYFNDDHPSPPGIRIGVREYASEDNFAANGSGTG